jgi:hypothetical protein
MIVLTAENTTFDLNTLGVVLTQDIRFAVFDYADKQNPDYYFRSLVMTESFNSFGVELAIGKYSIQVPSEWSLVLADPETADVEIIPVDEINNRDFHAFVFNPINGYYPQYKPAIPVDIFTDVRWVTPRLSLHNFLVLPLVPGESPDCILMINEKDQKKIPPLTIDQIT